MSRIQRGRQPHNAAARSIHGPRNGTKLTRRGFRRGLRGVIRFDTREGQGGLARALSYRGHSRTGGRQDCPRKPFSPTEMHRPHESDGSSTLSHTASPTRARLLFSPRARPPAQPARGPRVRQSAAACLLALVQAMSLVLVLALVAGAGVTENCSIFFSTCQSVRTGCRSGRVPDRGRPAALLPI